MKEISSENGHFTTEQVQKMLEMGIDPRNTVKKIREALGMSNWGFYEKLEKSPRVAEKLARARNESMEDLADSLLTILDDEPDTLRARLKSENIRWILSKRKPATYGDRLEVNVTQTIDIAQALAEARARASLPIVSASDVIDAESKTITTDSESVDDIFK